MRIILLQLLLLALFYSPEAQSQSAQSKPLLEERTTFEHTTAKDDYIWKKYIEDKNQLLLLSAQRLQLFDLTTRKLITTRAITLPPLNVRREYDLNEWQISPDGRRMLVLGIRDATVGKKQSAWIWDLETGKRIAVLEQTQGDIRLGGWSPNGKTLITFDKEYLPYFTTNLEVTFWDGETFAHRQTLSLENVTFYQLSRDGERFFAASGKKSRLVGIAYVRDSAGVINAWNTTTGQLEKTISLANANFSPKTREISISPDERFLVVVNKHKTNKAESRLLVWELNGSIDPLYELKPQPRIDDSDVKFSRDGKYFALDVGRNLQIHETDTGQKKAELTNVELPDAWLSNEVLMRVISKNKSIWTPGRMLVAVNSKNGQTLYRHRIEYEASEVSNAGGGMDTWVTDETFMKPHPTRDLFITQSDDYVKLFDTRTGELLQVLSAPPDGSDKNAKPVHPHLYGIEDARWTNDGKTLIIQSSYGRVVSFWELKDN